MTSFSAGDQIIFVAMPKLSGLTTEGEATVPLGDLSPYTEEQLLERVHRVHILFACMDCKKSWVELKEMLRHMVDGDCDGEKTGKQYLRE